MRRILAATVGVYILSLWGAWAASSAPAAAPSAGVARLKALQTDRPLAGFTINLHHTEQLPLYVQSIDEIAELGADSLQIITPAFQAHGASPQPRVEAGPGHGPHAHQLEMLLKHARKRGLSTALMPIVLFTEPRGNEWRGKTSPPDWDQWWAGYRQVIDHFLDIAVECDVDLFSIGSELLTTERQHQRWADLIRHVRSRYKGRLFYSTNWDHFHVPTFWDQIDVIGISGYWDLTIKANNGEPTDAQLVERWEEIQLSVFAFSVTQDKPFIITEVGYHTLPWTLSQPWNYVNDRQAAPDPAPQARGYASFLAAWSDKLEPPTEMAGVYFYAWDPYYAGGPEDTGYGVRGKPALKLLRDWFRRRR